jgi:hypothetical protein
VKGYDSFSFFKNLNAFCFKIVFEVIKGFFTGNKQSLERINLRPKARDQDLPPIATPFK